MNESYTVEAIGQVRSELVQLGAAPLQGNEGAPSAWLEIAPRFEPALLRVEVGDELILLTWLHRADRGVLQVHPRNDTRSPLTGVFATRSQDRPNPVGLHPVEVIAKDGPRLQVAPLEAIDGTPVIDIKIALRLR